MEMNLYDLLNTELDPWENQEQTDNDLNSSSCWFENILDISPSSSNDTWSNDSPVSETDASPLDNFDKCHETVEDKDFIQGRERNHSDAFVEAAPGSPNLNFNSGNIADIILPNIDLECNLQDKKHLFYLVGSSLDLAGINTSTSHSDPNPENDNFNLLLEEARAFQSTPLPNVSNPNRSSELVMRITGKRHNNSPYNKANRNLKHNYALFSPPISAGKSLASQGMVIKSDEHLLVLPNGEIYKKVVFPKDSATLSQVAKENTAFGAIDLSLKSQNGALEIRPASPSSSSDSGFSLSSSPSSNNNNNILRSYISSNELPAYTLTEVLFANPPPREGVLLLTDEEKNCLVAEGYPLPCKLPLDKDEERFLKKIRRKIKNKVSAQESRRRKKEYTDNMETKLKHYCKENQELLKRLEALENNNKTLLGQLQFLQNRVQFTGPTKGGACFMVLVVFFAMFIGSWDFKTWNIGYSKVLTTTGPSDHFFGHPILGPSLPKLERAPNARSQKILGLGPNIQQPVVENYFEFKVETMLATDDTGQEHTLEKMQHPKLPETMVNTTVEDSCDEHKMRPFLPRSIGNTIASLGGRDKYAYTNAIVDCE